ncbi:DNA adenine methylase [Peteryoungia aggregata LMG 23059]|uniref:Site-specific DNA-methyltransferase (adenine-specific) n=1 Tax=Peteryoungia aggregata LMG 23059 TaxID=1368425 RepID=A0ABU0G932_9HYPH|nr:Dam family site-specific DNA-(adenine-N6)-methyltransferase [Peteryoungia aggregata]MDQ0421860.1 DNA adenine methylase [Peteryoungia aggregata LMG 23059]
MTRQPLKPFLKWAGGKRWLFETGQFSLPKLHRRYIEPFLGGGAVFFENQPRNAMLSDANWRLIELYTVIRDELEEFELLVRQHASAHSKQYYYEMRSEDFKNPIRRAAQFFYLNRTCWNGLYRENLLGKFNVPIGTKQNVIFETDDFFAWSQALQGTTLLHRDFEEAIDEAEEEDFIFVDPPYTVRHNMNGFVKYNQNIFAWDDQIRLRDALVRASSRGAIFAMTNADHDSIRELYSGIGKQRQLSRNSVIAGRAAHRGQSTELLVVGGL